MKHSIFALGIALSIALAACEKSDMPGPAGGHNNSGHQQPSGNLTRRPQTIKMGTLRIIDDRNTSVTCAMLETHHHAEPVGIDTGFRIGAVLPGMNAGTEGNSHQ